MKHKRFPIKDYKGTHWTQRPENKKRLSEQLKKAHKAAKMKTAAKQIVAVSKRATRKPQGREFAIVRIGGWRFTLESNEIKIERA